MHRSQVAAQPRSEYLSIVKDDSGFITSSHAAAAHTFLLIAALKASRWIAVACSGWVQAIAWIMPMPRLASTLRVTRPDGGEAFAHHRAAAGAPITELRSARMVEHDKGHAPRRPVALHGNFNAPSTALISECP